MESISLKLNGQLIPEHNFEGRSSNHHFGNYQRKSTLADTLFHAKEKRSGLSLENVIGEDERFKIADTMIYPFSAICALKLYFPHQNDPPFAGSGALISPNVVLTCAHNFYDQKAKAQAYKVQVAPAQPKPHTFPFGEFDAKEILYPKEFQENPIAALDFGAVILDKAIGEETGYFRVLEARSEDFSRFLLHLTGYPAMIKYDGGTSKIMWTHSAGMRSITDGELRYFIDTSGGNSGSPVYFYEGNNPDLPPSIVAVHSGGRPDYPTPSRPAEYNMGAHITGEVFETILGWIEKGKEYL